jgi:hypothetical protein
MSYFASLAISIYYTVKYGLFDVRKEIYLLPAVAAGMIVAKAFNFVIGF